MSMIAVLFKGTEPFEQIVNISLTEGPIWNLVKTIQAISEKKIFIDFTILYKCIAQGPGQITPKISSVAKHLNPLRKHAYSNILKILQPKMGKFPDKKFWYFSYFCSKHRLWVLVRTASTRRF